MSQRHRELNRKAHQQHLDRMQHEQKTGLGHYQLELNEREYTLYHNTGMYAGLEVAWGLVDIGADPRAAALAVIQKLRIENVSPRIVPVSRYRPVDRHHR